MIDNIDFVNFDDLVKSSVQRIDRRVKNRNAGQKETDAYKRYRQSMKILFDDPNMFDNGE